MPLTAYPGLLADRGAPYLNTSPLMTSGRVWFVHSGGSNNQAGDDGTRPYATLAYALTKVRANRGDYIIVMPGHTETISTALAVSTAGVSIIGLGVGYSRPQFTSSGAIDLVSVTGANCVLENLRFTGAASCTALLDIAAAGLTVRNCVFEHGAAPLNAITVGADRFQVLDCYFQGIANGPDTAFFFEVGGGTLNYWRVENCTFNYLPNGLDKAVFLATADGPQGGIIKNCDVLGLDAAALMVDFNSSSSLGEGMLINTVWQHLAAATIANGLDLGGFGTAYIGAADGPVRAAELLPATSAT